MKWLCLSDPKESDTANSSSSDEGSSFTDEKHDFKSPTNEIQDDKIVWETHDFVVIKYGSSFFPCQIRETRD